MNILNTSASSEFFSRTINLVASARRFSKKKFGIRVWDLGLNHFEVFILKLIDVEVVKIPEFCVHWRESYSWKPYVIKNAPESIFLHLDSGNTVLSDINEIFDLIEKEGYFFIDQGQVLSDITPDDYISTFKVEMYKESTIVAAGNIGFLRTNKFISAAVDMTYSSAIQGLCLGYSITEASRAKNRNYILRKCKTFRHDQTVLNCSLYANIGSMNIKKHEIYAAIKEGEGVKIFNQRKVSYKYVIYLDKWHKLLVIPYCIFNDTYHYVANKSKKIKRRFCNSR